MVEKTVEHLFWHCPFAQQCWGILNLNTIQAWGTFKNVIAIKDQRQSQFFMVAVILMSWTIWWARNELIFNNNQVGIQDCKKNSSEKQKKFLQRSTASLSAIFDQWIQNL